jgi:hypothetical protein
MLVREIASMIGALRYSVDKALHDLHELELISHEQTDSSDSYTR